MAVRHYPQIVLFGDSLFQGAAEIQQGFSFQGALQHYCNRRYDVVNRGFSGYNTTHALGYLPQIFTPASEHAPKIEYFFILLGANDAVLDVPWASQHVPLDKYKENLRKIVSHPAITSHGPKIFIVTPPPLDEIHTTRRSRALGDPGPHRHASVSEAYSCAAREVAAEAGVGLVDLYQGLMDRAAELTPGFEAGGPRLGTEECGKQGGLELLLYDGLHMSGEGYKVLHGLVRPIVEAEWADAPEEERKGYLFPYWMDVDLSKVES